MCCSETAAADFLDDASAPFVRVDTSVKRDPYPVAVPLKGGKLRVLFIGRRYDVGLVSVGVARRLDCTFETILTESRKLTGLPPDRAPGEAGVLSAESVEKLAGQLFRDQWDVIWLDFDLKALPEGFRLTVLDRIEKGAGLVYVGNSRDLSDLKTEGRIDVTRLNAVTFGKFSPSCPGKLKRGYVTVMPPLDFGAGLNVIEDYLMTSVNTILFASGRFEMVTVVKIPETGKIVEQESIDIMHYRINLDSTLDTQPLTVFARYRNELGRLETETSTSYKIEKGKSFIIIEYPFLPTGPYSVDLSIADSDGVIALAGTSFTVVAQRRLADLEFWEKSAPEGGLIIGKVKAVVPYTDAMRVRVELLDCHGRSIERNELIPPVNMKEVDFAFRMGRLKEHSVIVRATLIQSNRVVQRIEKPAFIRKQYDFRRFSLIVSDSRPLEPIAAKRYAVLRDAGVTLLEVDVTSLNDPRDMYKTVLQAASSGTGVIPRITRIASTASGNIMDPVITDLEYNEKLEQRVTAAVDTLRNMSPVGYSLGRGNMLTPYDIDVSFSETDLESFTNYLQDKYETIDALNSAWRSKFPSFENARPVKLADAVRTNDYGAWLDTRLHMEEVFTQVHYGARDAFDASGSKTLVGIDGFENALNPFRGYNPFELTGFLSVIVSEQDIGRPITPRVNQGADGDRSISGMLSSFTQPGSLVGLSLGGDRYRRGTPALLHAAPWQSLFMGMNGVWWREAYGSIESALTPQLTIAPSFSIVAEEANEIANGIDVLLLGGVRLVDPIGILYSPVSKMATMTSGFSDLPTPAKPGSAPVGGSDRGAGIHAYERSIRSLYLACQDAGYTPMFVSDDQLTGDWLTKNRYKVLILPFIQAMSDDVSKCIEQFVRNGGTVIADMRTGVMDDHLFLRDSGVLDGIFGITQGKERIAPRIAGSFRPLQVEGGLPAIGGIESCRTDPSVKASEGSYVMALIDETISPPVQSGSNREAGGVQGGGTPAVIVNRYGMGTAIFLNMGMDAYETLRAQGREETLRNIVSWCLSASGIGSPYCSVGDSTGRLAPKVSVTVFRDDVFEYVGLLPDPLADKREYGDSRYYLDLRNTGKTYYVYNMRTKEFLGANLMAPLKLEPGKAELFALVPYRVKDLDVRLKTPVVQVGGVLEYTVSVIPQPLLAKPARHVFAIDVTGPDGVIIPFRSENFEADKGLLESSLAIAQSDPPGRWTLGVTDIITGKHIERAFMVMATGNLIIK